MISPKLSRDIARIIPFIVIWFVFSIVYLLLEKGLLGNLNHYPSTANPYSFGKNIFVTPIISMVTGTLIGIIEVVYLNRVFAGMSLSRKILLKTVLYLFLIILFLLSAATMINSLELNVSLFSTAVLGNAIAFLTDSAFLSISLYMGLVIIITLFYLEMSENIGQNVLINFLIGKYHKPTEEERIYMFLDMRSSTTIAEQLGHIRYFQMLKAYYADISAPIISFSGEIYQYVGDELIVSWKLNKGLRDNNCIRCFFAMQSAIQEKAEKYRKTFGIVPGFKAGLHYGRVTTGEIGTIKKEIVFSGDVLNTTARIQQLCNTYKVDLLISGHLLQQLTPEPGMSFQSLGVNELRGRNETLELFSIAK